MIYKLAEKIVEIQINSNKINANERRIYEYGYTVAFEVMVNLIISLIIGIAFNSLLYVFAFLCLYIPLRSFCGGWHADTFLKCTVVSTAILFGEVFFIKYLIQDCNLSVILSIFLICFIGILGLAPVQTATKPIGEAEKTAYRKKIYIIVIMHLMILLIMFGIHKFDYAGVMMYTYIVQLFMLVLEKTKIKLQNKEEE